MVFLSNQSSELIFEIFCYFKKAKELMDRRKTPQFKNLNMNIFCPHAKPGRPKSASYISFSDQVGETLDLFLNGKFRGMSNIYHSPDLVLAKSKNGQIVSIYECKNHSGPLELGVYREFIGYCEEMGLLVRGNRSHIRTLRDSYPELRPCIYTSATANGNHKNNMRRYDFTVIDKL